MKEEIIEVILKNIGSQDVPDDVNKLAEKTSIEFGKTVTQSKQPKHIVLLHHIRTSKMTQLAAAAVIIVAVLIAIHQMAGNGTSAVYASVVEQLQNARTMTYSLITQTKIDPIQNKPQI